MPRRTRMYVAGFPYHVVHRGNNRQVCFRDTDDRLAYLDFLAESVERYEVSLHAFVLMTNHVHLLLTPRDNDGVSLAMKVAASRFAHFVNKRHTRTGTLWEGRHKAGAVEQDSHLLWCHRYIEMNPVRAGLAATAADYRWSSYRANALGENIDWLTPHPILESLGATAEARCCAYRGLFAQEGADVADQAIREATGSGMAFGSEVFRLTLASQAGCDPGYARRGRPRRCAIS